MKRTHSWLLTIIFSFVLFALACEAALGPSCTTNDECFSNAVCENGECHCTAEYVISGNWTQCLPMIAVPYNSTCEESPQCTARMGPGAVCSEGICVCSADYHYLHGLCYRSADYGEHCDHEDECYGGYSYESLYCDANSTCSCAPGFELVKEHYGICRRVGYAVGEECFFDIDCKATNTVCDFSAGLCVDNSATSMSLSNNETDSIQMKSVTLMKATCKDSSECSQSMDCILGACVCKAGYYMAGTVCLRDIGEACLTDTDCSGLGSSTCKNNVCACKAGYFANDANNLCLTGVTASCEESECLAEFSECNETTHTCVCPGLNVSNVAYSKCLPVGAFGSNCEEDVQCTGFLGEEGGGCVDGVCGCINGYHYNNDYCWEIRHSQGKNNSDVLKGRKNGCIDDDPSVGSGDGASGKKPEPCVMDGPQEDLDRSKKRKRNSTTQQ
ncbi:hypothetical protein C0J52_26751 [Blattella germanica]|nr:hypothetical protein C0J52_26751 [Blattella germanica]